MSERRKGRPGMMRGLTDARKQPNFNNRHAEIMPIQNGETRMEMGLEVNESYLTTVDGTNESHQLHVATKLMEGKVASPCVKTAFVDGTETIVSKCPLLSLTEGCAKALIIENETVSCPKENGPIKIQSLAIGEIAISPDVMQSMQIEMGDIIEIMERKIA